MTNTYDIITPSALAPMDTEIDRKALAREAKAIVALAFRNGPIEDIHAGKLCPTCSGLSGYSRITNQEMKALMKTAVDRVFALLLLKAESTTEYERQVEFGEQYTVNWDDPEPPGAHAGRTKHR